MTEILASAGLIFGIGIVFSFLLCICWILANWTYEGITERGGSKVRAVFCAFLSFFLIPSIALIPVCGGYLASLGG